MIAVKRNPQHASGVALISALLVVALATTAAVALSASMQLNLRRSANLYLRDQAWEYLLGVEEFGKVLLKQAIEHNKLDLLLGEERALPVEGGVVTGRIIDLQAGININDLVTDKGRINAVARDRIEGLFQAQGVDIKKIDSLIDWLDKNDQASGDNGAEDNYYFGLEPPYRAANGQMESLSELYLIREMKPEDIDKLVNTEADGKPVKMLTAIHKPASQLAGLTLVNINTAPEAVLSAIGIKDTEAVIKNRPYEKMPTAEALGFKTTGKDKDRDSEKFKGMGITSNYFELEASAQIGHAKLRSFSIIERGKDNAMTVISRSFGTE